MKLLDIKGIGKKKEEVLNSMDIYSVDDLINYFPRAYEDRSRFVDIDQALDGLNQSFILTIKTRARTYYHKKGSITNLKAYDQSKEINLVWYNNRFAANNLRLGQEYKFFGKYDKEKNRLINPVFTTLDKDDIGGIYPIYSIKKGISNKDMIKFLSYALDNYSYGSDFIDGASRKKFKLLSDKQIIYSLHKPIDYMDLYRAKRSYSMGQMVLRNVFFHKLKEKRYAEKAIVFKNFNLEDQVYNLLDFKLTKGQLSSLEEIKNDMYSKLRMNRILIGDVGSGKTVVGILAAIIAIKSDYQVAFMAPTEILAIQHFNNYRDLLAKLDIDSELLTGSISLKEKKRIYGKLEEGRTKLIFGTHALFQEEVTFNKLGLVITDEQQRFGVEQRKRLEDKGEKPDILILTATPIPRTLALTIYGDLDVSVIDSLPENRKKIDSFLVDTGYERRFMDFARKEIDKGRQVYVIASRIEEDDDLASVFGLLDKYRAYYGPEVKIDFIHGKMDSDEKERKQELFIGGKIDILIATTIIEVGIDNKNASLMIIYDANQFGMTQLHQLRGRVGRGEYKSYCILVKPKGLKDDDKLKFLEKSDDGFEIAQKDMELRGAGNILGLEQSGYEDNLFNDLYINDIIFKETQEMTEYIIEERLYESDEFSEKLKKYEIENNKIVLN